MLNTQQSNTSLKSLLIHYQNIALTEREKGTYFEKLTIQYLKHEPFYQDLYDEIYTYAQWARLHNLDARDTGIDLVAKTKHANEYHAIQCKFYNFDTKINKSDIDSFFTTSGKIDNLGKHIFSNRIIITTCDNWSEHANEALQNQNPPSIKISLTDLENSQIDWSKFNLQDKNIILKPKKELRPHQKDALKDIIQGLKNAERGKLIMACGTGKTFTSLKIAENLAGSNKRVLFLVPSLALLSQTLTEWTQESSIPLHSFAVCSDSEVGKKKTNKNEETNLDTLIHELKYPATTNAKHLAFELDKRHDEKSMSVVFSTYHSINVISQAQSEYNLADFDLIICDEAHRTTGQTFDNEDDSNFTKIHDNNIVKGYKRLYMTATPRIYSNTSQAKAIQQNIKLHSMNDENIYGKDLHTLSFSKAVQQQLLVDYKVIVLAIDAEYVNSRIQSLLNDKENGLQVDDAAKIIGCWKALSKIDTNKNLDENLTPMQRAVAFCQVIEQTSKAKTNQISSKKIASMFQAVVDEYVQQENLVNPLKCEVQHVDGTMNASQKETKLNWIKENFAQNTCRILSNVRCLSEGVDVPTLDAVLFLAPKHSQVDVVQSVGRVMRKSAGKECGYVILPVVIPSNQTPEQSLDDNKTYKVVWQVLEALRSHDDKFDAEINKLDITDIKKLNSKIEVIAISDKIAPKKSTNKNQDIKNAKGDNLAKEAKQAKNQQLKQLTEKQMGLDFQVGEIEKAIYAKIVEKCGNRNFWQDWSDDIAGIALKHILRIKLILENPQNTQAITAFNNFTDELRDDLNEAITNDEVIEMLAQHLITKPVFDALFEENYNFASQNPISKAMQNVLDILQQYNIDKESESLEGFYASVKMRASGIENIEAKQKIIIELYDKFFKKAFPKMTQRLGIVYTPVEVVDFIIHSINDVLGEEFNLTLGDKNVHIIDPFTGTGTFITRLLQSGLISKEQLEYKYKHEIHANEIVLLAYYIAAINIEAVYHAIAGGEYIPFEGICLTDTFQSYENQVKNSNQDLIHEHLKDNSKRIELQKALNIKVIMGNPPYSVGQTSANDNNANIAYPKLDESIRNTYAKYSKATLKNSLYDSYIRAIRWASDRIASNEGGIIGFVSGNGFIEKPAMDGMRKCLGEEFSSIYILNLRGDIRKNMLSQGRAKEGENIFGNGSMTGIAITIFVKNPLDKQHGKIYYYDIGDDLKEIEKLNKVLDLQSIKQSLLQQIIPDKHNDWLTQRTDDFEQFISMGYAKNKIDKGIFNNYSMGVATSRDAWCYNFSQFKVSSNMQRMIDFYNSEVQRYKNYCDTLSKDNYPKIQNFVYSDDTKIKWSSDLHSDCERKKYGIYNHLDLSIGLYRPFTKNWLYFSSDFNDRVGQIPKMFPQNINNNLAICISGIGARSGFSALICRNIPNMDIVEKSQCFPLYLYEKSQADNQDLFSQHNQNTEEYTRKDAITDAGLKHFQDFYKNYSISKEDLFYYIYGLLHSIEYKTKYANNLSKELPRIPAVKTFDDFIAFSTAGRKLAHLHLNYENIPANANVSIEYHFKDDLEAKNYYVTKMKFGKNGKDKDKSTIIYNDFITIKNIPLKAYEYIVNGKPAIEWVMDRQGVSMHKDSQIVNDANDWAIETMNDAKYPLKLLLSVIEVSMQTVDIVENLPKVVD